MTLTNLATRSWWTLALGLLALLVAATPAAADRARSDSVLYELTERMVFEPSSTSGSPFARIATAALQGTAAFGTPWCPAELQAYYPTAQGCTIMAIGGDDVDVVPSLDGVNPNPNFGKGTVWADWATVINVDNPVDGPEFIVLTGRFTGNIDLSQAAAGIAPLGLLVGQITIDGVPASFPLTGTFRLPFAKDASGKMERRHKGKDAFYLMDNGHSQRVRGDELSVGWPTVRLEITFAP